MAGMNDILAPILGGGDGSRLRPLTRMRSKPAVPIAGKYRLIDIPISNCINPGIYRIDILTSSIPILCIATFPRPITSTLFTLASLRSWLLNRPRKC